MGVGALIVACVSRNRVEPMPVAGNEDGPREQVEADVLWHRAALEREAELQPSGVRPTSSGLVSPLPPFSGVNREEAQYVGGELCASCHRSVADHWETTAHAHALQTLTRKRADSDPRCLRCHTQGVGRPGGYSGQVELADVGCEACHGPGSDHVKAPQQRYGQLPAEGAACVACHTLDRSPDFRWESHWPPIAHGD